MTTHWWYAFGTNPRPTTYTLDGRTVTSPFVLAALLQARWCGVEASSVRFHGFWTTQLGAGDPSPMASLRQAVPSAVADAVARTWQDDAYCVDDRDLWTVVERVLEEVHDGDEVLVEATGGLRHVVIGLLLAVGLLSTLKPKVRVRSVTYAEFDGRVFDVAPFVDLFGWAVAGDALGRALDAGPLVARLRSVANQLRRAKHEGSVPAEPAASVEEAIRALDALAPALALTWPRELAAGLQGARAALKKLAEQGDGGVLAGIDRGHVAVAYILRLAAGGLVGLLGSDTDPNRLDDARLAFDLALAGRLQAAGRHGDALRLLREWVVNWVLLAWREDAWLEPEARGRAESALNREGDSKVGRVWRGLAQLRNDASHARMSPDRPDQVTPGRVTVSVDKLLSKVAELLDAEPPARPQRRCWLGNAFSLNMIGGGGGGWTIDRVEVEDLRELALESCVGHPDTAAWFSKTLGRSVVVNRVTIALEPGDELYVGQLLGERLPAGTHALPDDGGRWGWFRVRFHG